jgi:biopolymer transport protein ExbD
MRWLIAAAILVSLGGCGPTERKPIPVISIEVLDKQGEYLLNGKPVFESELKSGLQELADDNRRNITGNSRAYVRITSHPNVPYARVQDVAGLCASVGLDKITTATRTEPAKPAH